MWRVSNPGFNQLVAGVLFVVLAVGATLLSFVGRGERNEPRGSIVLGERLAAYDFTADADGWRAFTVGELVAFGWDAGEQAMRMDAQVELGHALTTTTRDFRDTSVTVRLASAELPTDTHISAGVVCRADTDGNGYYFLVSDSGRASIQAGYPDEPDDLVRLVDWTPVPSMLPITDENLLTGVCAADYLALSVNGVFVADVRDDRFRDGLLGLAIAGSVGADADGAAVERRHVVIYAEEVTVTDVRSVGGR